MPGSDTSHSADTGRPPHTAVLRVHGREVANYVWERDLPLAASPRPYLHPVRTLGGITVTDAAPESHSHQFGISVAAPDVAGRNFWGGRTFVAGHGPAYLDNHGLQRHQRWLRHTTDELAHILRWTDAHDTTLLEERRSITGRPAGPEAWALTVHTQLTNVTREPLPIRSPIVHGRPGAGYGGVFWRGPAVEHAGILSPAGHDVRAVHGSTADWVAITGAGRHGQWSVLCVHPDETAAGDRWFVRARDYLGVCSSVTWDRPLVLSAGESIIRRVTFVIVDGVLSLAAAGDLAGSVRQRA